MDTRGAPHGRTVHLPETNVRQARLRHRSAASSSETRFAPPRTLHTVSTVEQPEEPSVHIYPPDEALERARPLPPRDELVLEDVSDDEWAAFQEALATA